MKRSILIMFLTLVFIMISSFGYADDYKKRKQIESLYGQIYYLYIGDKANHTMCRNDLDRYSLMQIQDYIGRKSPSWMRENIWSLRKKQWEKTNALRGDHHIPKIPALIYLNILAEKEGIDFLSNHEDLSNVTIKFNPVEHKK